MAAPVQLASGADRVQFHSIFARGNNIALICILLPTDGGPVPLPDSEPTSYYPMEGNYPFLLAIHSEDNGATWSSSTGSEMFGSQQGSNGFPGNYALNSSDVACTIHGDTIYVQHLYKNGTQVRGTLRVARYVLGSGWASNWDFNAYDGIDLPSLAATSLGSFFGISTNATICSDSDGILTMFMINPGTLDLFLLRMSAGTITSSFDWDIGTLGAPREQVADLRGNNFIIAIGPPLMFTTQLQISNIWGTETDPSTPADITGITNNTETGGLPSYSPTSGIVMVPIAQFSGGTFSSYSFLNITPATDHTFTVASDSGTFTAPNGFTPISPFGVSYSKGPCEIFYAVLLTDGTGLNFGIYSWRRLSDDNWELSTLEQSLPAWGSTVVSDPNSGWVSKQFNFVFVVQISDLHVVPHDIWFWQAPTKSCPGFGTRGHAF